MNLPDLPTSNLIENPAAGSHQRAATALRDGLEPHIAEDICTVCGWKEGECREPFSHLRHGAKMISICSPNCMEAFQREPDRFAADERAQPLLNAPPAPMR